MGVKWLRGNSLPKDKFFRNIEREGLALTFDDVSLRTGHSKTVPDEVDTKSRFSRNIPLLIPIVSSPMDTVTEYQMAIALAKLGGLGIIHKNLSPEEQAYQVGRVKYHLNGRTGLIEKPICVHEHETIEEILKRKEEKDYHFDSFPVLDKNDKLVGILTGNDFTFCVDYSIPAGKLMTPASELKTAPQGTDMNSAYEIIREFKKKHLPIVDGDGRIVGLYSYKDLKNIKLGVSAGYNLDKRGHLLIGAAVGVGDDAFSRLELLVKNDVDVIVIDSAHADSDGVLRTLRELVNVVKKDYPGIDVVAGNVSEAESAERLIKAGADGVKVGQGPGAICTTRPVAGVGTPQITAVYNCSKIGDKYGVPINADGGLSFSGDIPKAVGAGASSVMMGSMLAGTDESPGDIIFKKGSLWKSFRGMGSLSAMAESKASRDRYSQSDTGKSEIVPEGVEAEVPYKGALEPLIIQYVGGLRRGMGYVGANNIDGLRRKANFFRITASGRRESHPHDVVIVREAPNYRRG